MYIRCDLCPGRHRPGSKAFFMHLGGRAEDDLAEPTRSDLRALRVVAKREARARELRRIRARAKVR